MKKITSQWFINPQKKSIKYYTLLISTCFLIINNQGLHGQGVEITADANSYILDHFNNSSSGTTYNTLEYITGLGGLSQAANFTNSGFVKYYCNTSLLYAATIEFWVKPTAYGTGLICFNSNNASSTPLAGYYFHSQIDATGKIKISDWTLLSGTITEFTSNSSIPLNQWTHIAISWGSSTKIYINGAIDNQTTSAFRPFATTTYVYFPYWGTGTTSGIAIDELHISNIQRTDAEVATHASLFNNTIISTENYTTNVDKTFDVKIKTNELVTSQNAVSYQFNLNYDAAKIQYVDNSLTETIADGGTVVVNSSTAGLLQISYTTNTALIGSGDILKLHFKGIAEGNSALTLSKFLYNSSSISNLTSGTVNVRENIPPTATITYSKSTAKVKSGDNLIITATFNEEIADAPIPQISLSGTVSLAATNMTKVSSTIYTYSYTVENTNGQVNVSLLAGTDIAGNVVVATPTSGGSFVIDNVAPTVAIGYSDTDAKVKPNDVVTVTATFNEEMADAPIPQISLSGAVSLAATNMTKVSSTVYTYSYTVENTNGQVNVSLLAGTDIAGNVVVVTPTSGGSFVIDNVAPTVAISYSDISGSFHYGENITITATLSEPIIDNSTLKIALSGANTLTETDMIKVSATVYTYTYTIAKGDGTVNVMVSNVTDEVGNAVTPAPISGASFNVIPLRYGDIDDNTYVQTLDAALALQYSVGLTPKDFTLPWATWRITTGDVDNIPNITANDASLILKFSAGLISTFPVSEKNNTDNSPTATINIEAENGYLYFSSIGELYGLNLTATDNIGLLGQPLILNSNMIFAQNITSTCYAIGLATAYTPANNEIFMKIPFSPSQNINNLIFNLIVNGESKQATVKLTTGITDLIEQSVFLYPNPVNNILFINGFTTNPTISIYDTDGKIVLSRNIPDNKIDISNLMSGFYLIKIHDNNKITTMKFIKQ